MEVTIETEYVNIECTVQHGSITAGEFEDFELVPDTKIKEYYHSDSLTDTEYDSYLEINVALYRLINFCLERADQEPWYEDYVRAYEKAEREAKESAHWEKVDHQIDERKAMLRGL